MRISEFRDASIFENCRHEWADLLAHSVLPQIFLTSEWLHSWWAAYRPGELRVLVIADEHTGRWLGAAPWFISPDGGSRVLCTVGCVDVTDYLDVLVRQGAEDTVYPALADWLAAHTDDWDEAQFCNIPEESPTLERLPALVEARGLAATIEEEDVCPQFAVPDTFENYLARLDSKRRHELRRKLRRATGQADWYIVGSEHDLAAEIERFLDLMAASSPEKRQFLEDAGHREFIRTVMPRLAAHGWLQLAFLTVGKEAVASYLNFDYQGRILVYNSGLEPGRHAQLSPGIVLLAYVVEHAIEQQRRVFDFMRGDEPYKYDMGGQDTRICRLTIRRANGGR